MNLTEQEEFIRHNCFREELYVYAYLPAEEFQEKVEQFKIDYKHLLSDEKPKPLAISKYQLKKAIRDKGGRFND